MEPIIKKLILLRSQGTIDVLKVLMASSDDDNSWQRSLFLILGIVNKFIVLHMHMGMYYTCEIVFFLGFLVKIKYVC